MRSGSVRSIPFTPPAEPREPRQVDLFTEPTQPLLILGEMVRDVNLMLEMLRGLPFAGDHYSADLQVIAGAAKRTRDRAAKLIGDE